MSAIPELVEVPTPDVTLVGELRRPENALSAVRPTRKSTDPSRWPEAALPPSVPAGCHRR